MNQVAILCSVVLGVLALYQLMLTVGFVFGTRRREQAPIGDEALPPAVVLLAMRGADPDSAKAVLR